MNAAAKNEVSTGVDFSFERWESVKANSNAWWNRKLGRPLLKMTLHGAERKSPPPLEPLRRFHSYYDLSVPAEKIVDAFDYQLSGERYLGDSFPSVWPNFGPGVIAALMGCDLHNGSEEAPTVWYHPGEVREAADIHFEYLPESIWFRRIKDIMKAAGEKWRGLVQIGMTDLGGNLDILSSFRPSEALLYDLYDEPEEVKRLTWEAHELWWRYFEEFNEILQATNPGYSAWPGIFSEESHYMLQCDFCYMIGPDMFDEFVKPELAASCKKLKNAFYHLDGPGQLPHLDSLLEIEELAGVQWVPGDGNANLTEWPDVYRKIKDAGKLIQIWNGKCNPGWRSVDIIAEQIGSTNGEEIVLLGWADIKDEKEVEKFLLDWNAI